VNNTHNCNYAILAKRTQFFLTNSMTSKTADIQFIDESGGGPVLRLRKPPQQQKRQEPAATFLRNEPNFSNEAEPALVPLEVRGHHH